MSEVFSGRKGKFVELAATIQGFRGIFIINIKLALLDGEGDEYPENAFYMQGTFEDVIEEAKRVAAEATTSKWFMYGTYIIQNTK